MNAVTIFFLSVGVDASMCVRSVLYAVNQTFSALYN